MNTRYDPRADKITVAITEAIIPQRQSGARDDLPLSAKKPINLANLRVGGATVESVTRATDDDGIRR